MAGCPQPGFTTAELEDAYIRNLCYAAEQFEKEGLMGLIEPLCKQVRRERYEAVLAWERTTHEASIYRPERIIFSKVTTKRSRTCEE